VNGIHSIIYFFKLVKTVSIFDVINCQLIRLEFYYKRFALMISLYQLRAKRLQVFVRIFVEGYGYM